MEPQTVYEKKQKKKKKMKMSHFLTSDYITKLYYGTGTRTYAQMNGTE